MAEHKTNYSLKIKTKQELNLELFNNCHIMRSGRQNFHLNITGASPFSRIFSSYSYTRERIRLIIPRKELKLKLQEKLIHLGFTNCKTHMTWNI